MWQIDPQHPLHTKGQMKTQLVPTYSIGFDAATKRNPPVVEDDIER
jgi:hypothetical protein